MVLSAYTLNISVDRTTLALPLLLPHKVHRSLLFFYNSLLVQGLYEKIVALLFGGTSYHLLVLLLGYYSLSISISHLTAFPLYSLTLLLHL